ncbi:MAG: YraN family protein [Ezakiella massiliensis]
MKADNKIVGNLGEDMACKYLKEKNYYILERNYRNKQGEIDIIAMDEASLSLSK